MSLQNLSFDRAQYDGPAPSLAHCTWCGRGLEDEWFEANSQIVCPICAANARAMMPSSTSRMFWKAVAWGAAAAVGLALALAIVQTMLLRVHAGYGFVLTAIPVGLYIGRAMRTATPARGRKYQLAAAALTYCAVSIGSLTALFFVSADVPLWIYLLLPLFPLVEIFTGNMQIAGITLFAASIAIRWAWPQLAAHGLKITGPFRR